jgi:hypothetical protein
MICDNFEPFLKESFYSSGEAMIRKAAVAGTFYDSSPERLKAAVRGFLREEERTGALGILVPHAGYLYSGSVAGAVYSRIEPAESYIILSPNHTGLGTVGSVMCRGGWETPLGTIPIDEALASAAVQGSPLLQEDSDAHFREHSIEVQLPFLQSLGPSMFVPITLMGLSYRQCEEVGSVVARIVQSSDKAITLVASSDMTHFESQDAARRKDWLALERVEALDPRGLYEVVRDRRISMCGFIPATIMLIAAKALGATRASVTRYATSGNVTGDLDEVVGYAGAIVT